MNRFIALTLFFFAFFLTLPVMGQMELKCMSFNIRYDNPDDGVNNWQHRKDNAASVVRFHDIDVVGFQEVLQHQLEDLRERLPGYSDVGVARDDGEQSGEYVPVFYKADRFSLMESGNFWLSENPSVPGKGWDAACNRIVTWVKLKEKSSGKVFAFFNTHFDHRGRVARKESVPLLRSKISAIAGELPVVVTGDFNATPESLVITHILDEEEKVRLRDTRLEADIVYNAFWTAHSFGGTPMENRRIIDYIFVNASWKVIRYGVLSELNNGVYLSDHCPVVSELMLEQK